MRVAIVGAGRTGLAAAGLLSEDPRQEITVFETRAQVRSEVAGTLTRLGVVLRVTAQVERVDHWAHAWIHGLPEPYDVILVATSKADARALLARSGLRKPLGERIFFAKRGDAHATLLRMAAEHPALRPRRIAEPRPRFALRSPVEYVDLGGHTWPLGVPAVYIANQRWLLDVVPRHLMVRSLKTLEPLATAAGHLEAGRSVAFVVEGTRHAPHGRGAALAALTVNAPIIPIAATGRPRGREPVRVVIGEPFYPETSSIDGLVDDMRLAVRHLEQLACASP